METEIERLFWSLNPNIERFARKQAWTDDPDTNQSWYDEIYTAGVERLYFAVSANPAISRTALITNIKTAMRNKRRSLSRAKRRDPLSASSLSTEQDQWGNSEYDAYEMDRHCPHAELETDHPDVLDCLKHNRSEREIATELQTTRSKVRTAIKHIENDFLDQYDAA